MGKRKKSMYYTITRILLSDLIEKSNPDFFAGCLNRETNRRVDPFVDN
jgi:hypothetical protein